MKKALTLLAVLAIAGMANAQWINEFHYDNSGTDANEFIEVILPASAAPADYSVTFYNGLDMGEDDTHGIDTFDVGDSVAGFTVYSKFVAGIQNGAPDGFSLNNLGTAIRFLSYEGDFTAADGPAAGMLSEDVGVVEGSSTLDSESLQLTGSGSSYSDFTWSGPSANSPGSVNNGQTLVPEPMTMGLLGVGALALIRRRKK